MPTDLLMNDKIIFFDSYCVLCNHFVKWVIDRDAEKKFHFAALDSDTAHELEKRFPEATQVDSIFYYDGAQVFTKGVAVRKVIQDLSTWKLLKVVAHWTPAFLLSFGYDLVAANRYKIFGKYDVCPPLPPEWRGRFKA